MVKHLATTKPGNRTAFEHYMFTEDGLWKNLEEFSQAEPAVLLWRDNGKYEQLFKFLAPRFLLAPDHVLDAERMHARWQWECLDKRALKLQTLNASLKLMHYMEHNQAFPRDQELLPFLRAEKDEHELALGAAADGPEPVVHGWRYMQAVWEAIHIGRLCNMRS